MQKLDVYLLEPRGFCAGVRRAIAAVDEALKLYTPPLYVYHDIVHNRQVVENLRARGAVFVEDLKDADPARPLIFSAHGVSKAIEKEARQRGFAVIIDATCPLVLKVHRAVTRFHKEGRHVFVIGHRNHPEVVGTCGQIPQEATSLLESKNDLSAALLRQSDNARFAYVTQTTLSVEETQAIAQELEGALPSIKTSSGADICYATRHRQYAVAQACGFCDIIYVVGSAHSSNSNRLVETARRKGCAAYLIEGAEAVDPKHFRNKRHLGLTAGASAPSFLVEAVLESLKRFAVLRTRVFSTEEENVSFSLPNPLRS